MKKNVKLFVSSLVILLPMLFGIVMYNKLPDSIATHWNAHGVNDGFSSKPFFVFGFPLLLLAAHLIATYTTEKDNAKRNQSKKVMTFVYFIIPVMGLIIQTYLYALSFGYTFDIGTVVFVLLAFMFIGLGNYLPKTKQNMTMGVKTSWALSSKDNWYHTHRFTGLLWVIGGILLLVVMFFPEAIRYRLLTVLIFVLGFGPIIYSFLYHLKEVKQGTFVKQETSSTSKVMTIAALVFTAVVIGVVTLILFTGKITYNVADDYVKMDATYYHEVSVSYDEIDTITYLEEDKAGIRKFGWGSFKLLLGTFENDAESQYMRYTYTNVDSVIRIQRTDGEVIIFNAESNEATAQLYQDILTKMKQ